FVFVATDARQGRLIRPAFLYHFAEDLPIYATSAAYEADQDANGRDMDGLMFADMPWVIADDADARAIRRAFERHWPSRVLRRSRLYAMGYDAYRLIPQLVARDTWEAPWPGVTGRLTLGAGGRIERDLDIAQIRGGAAVRLDPIVPPGYFDAFEPVGTPEFSDQTDGDTDPLPLPAAPRQE
ncbi:MAG: penicillin-binding protein activator, partial [Pseudomonadota bacterium]